jgi:TIR domain-containing protein
MYHKNMKVFLSHAPKDDSSARELAERLTHVGFAVWDPQEQIVPGDNWAKKIGKALDDSDLLVILLSPGAFKADGLRRDIEFAIGSKKYADRVFTIFVGPTLEAGKDVPWILLKLPNCQVESPNDFDEAVKEIQSLAASSGTSSSHA